MRVEYKCQFCNTKSSDKASHYARKVRHYCSMKCYSADRKENWKPSEQPTWRGGVTPYEAHKRWKLKNPERMAHLKARYYARRKNAEGSHTFEEWQELKAKFNNLCVNCLESKPLTKDHVIPLSKGGSDYITNIQPLCRNCNSKKWKFIYENPELLEAKNV